MLILLSALGQHQAAVWLLLCFGLAFGRVRMGGSVRSAAWTGFLAAWAGAIFLPFVGGSPILLASLAMAVLILASTVVRRARPWLALSGAVWAPLLAFSLVGTSPVGLLAAVLGLAPLAALRRFPRGREWIGLAAGLAVIPASFLFQIFNLPWQLWPEPGYELQMFASLSLVLIVSGGIGAVVGRCFLPFRPQSPWRVCRSCREPSEGRRCLRCGGRMRSSLRQRLNLGAGAAFGAAVLAGLQSFGAMPLLAALISGGLDPSSGWTLFQSAAIALVFGLAAGAAGRGALSALVGRIEEEYGEAPKAVRPETPLADPPAIFREAPSSASLPVDELRQRAGTAS